MPPNTECTTCSRENLSPGFERRILRTIHRSDMKIIDSVSYYKDNFPMPKAEAISQKPTSQPFQVDLRPSSFMLGDRKVGPLRQASHPSVVEWVFLLFPGSTQWLQGLEANLPSSLSDRPRSGIQMGLFSRDRRCSCH